MVNILTPQVWLMVIIVSLLGVFNKLIYFGIGKQGRKAILEHVPRMTPEKWESIEQSYQDKGVVVLLLASIPIIGSALTAAAGAFGTSQATVIVLVLASNLIRNWLLAVILGQTLSLLPSG